MRRMCASGTTVALAMTIASAPSLAAADGTVTDPKIWCGEAAKTMAGKDAEKLIDSVASAAGNLTDRHSLAQEASASRANARMSMIWLFHLGTFGAVSERCVRGERPFPAPKGGFRPSIYFN